MWFKLKLKFKFVRMFLNILKHEIAWLCDAYNTDIE
jgi:hypothetical protein